MLPRTIININAPLWPLESVWALRRRLRRCTCTSMTCSRTRICSHRRFQMMIQHLQHQSDLRAAKVIDIDCSQLELGAHSFVSCLNLSFDSCDFCHASSASKASSTGRRKI
jgi:hypothetical protein